jgi:myo-inositol-1-phosphate synthase
MNDKKCGVWIIGALGAISATVISGAALLRRGLIEPAGMVTATEIFEGTDLLPVEHFVFGGCDIRVGSLFNTLRQLASETCAISSELVSAVEDDLHETQSEIRYGTCRNCGEAIEGMASEPFSAAKPILEEVAEFRELLRSFKARQGLESVVVVNLASTEPPLAPAASHRDLAVFEEALHWEDSPAVRASTVYAYAAIQEQCPYVNFTPSTGALIPPLLQLAERMRVPVMGNDGKTGETLIKSTLAPMFLWRNLQVLSWEGFNMLGNMDGCVLANPENKESKVRTKDLVLSRILGYAPHSRVRIDYVPSLNDQKTAWDFIHFKGFMGAKMSLQFVWQGYDSLLAAPLVLDLVRLMELAGRRGECGLMPHLASYFKAPLGVDEYALHSQFGLLMDYIHKVKGDRA